MAMRDLITMVVDCISVLRKESSYRRLVSDSVLHANTRARVQYQIMYNIIRFGFTVLQ